MLEKVWEAGVLDVVPPLPLLREVNDFPLKYEGPTMDILDIGPRARIGHIKIEEGKLIAKGNATISPTPPFLVAMPEKKVNFYLRSSSKLCITCCLFVATMLS